MSKIYVVQGNCGEYSDRTDWLVKAFLSSEAATSLRDSLNKAAIKYGFDCGHGMVLDNSAEEQRRLKEMKSLDESFQRDYTGTYYCVLTVDLGDESHQAEGIKVLKEAVAFYADKKNWVKVWSHGDPSLHNQITRDDICDWTLGGYGGQRAREAQKKCGV